MTSTYQRRLITEALDIILEGYLAHLCAETKSSRTSVATNNMTSLRSTQRLLDIKQCRGDWVNRYVAYHNQTHCSTTNLLQHMRRDIRHQMLPSDAC